jgi:hypothetical protein
MQREQGLDPLPPLRNAKQRRLSRPNTSKEIRTRRQKRKQRKREEEKSMPKKAKRIRKANILKRKLELETKKIQYKLEEQSTYAKEQRKRAIYFWKKWHEQRQSDDSKCM